MVNKQEVHSMSSICMWWELVSLSDRIVLHEMVLGYYIQWRLWSFVGKIGIE